MPTRISGVWNGLWTGVTRLEAEKRNRAKNEFIRLLHNELMFFCKHGTSGRLFCFVSPMLKKQSQWLRQDVDRATRRQPLLLARELYVLEAILLATVHGFHEDGYFDRDAAAAEESAIRARHAEIEETVRTLEKVEDEYQDLRDEEPLLDEYMSKMFRFLRATSDKHDGEAAELLSFLRRERNGFREVWAGVDDITSRVDTGRCELVTKRVDVWNALRTLMRNRLEEQPEAIIDPEGNNVLHYRLSLHSYQILACRQVLQTLIKQQTAMSAIDISLEEQLRMLVDALASRWSTRA